MSRLLFSFYLLICFRFICSLPNTRPVYTFHPFSSHFLTCLCTFGFLFEFKLYSRVSKSVCVCGFAVLSLRREGMLMFDVVVLFLLFLYIADGASPSRRSWSSRCSSGFKPGELWVHGRTWRIDSYRSYPLHVCVYVSCMNGSIGSVQNSFRDVILPESGETDGAV